MTIQNLAMPEFQIPTVIKTKSFIIKHRSNFTGNLLGVRGCFSQPSYLHWVYPKQQRITFHSVTQCFLKPNLMLSFKYLQCPFNYCLIKRLFILEIKWPYCYHPLETKNSRFNKFYNYNCVNLRFSLRIYATTLFPSVTIV